MARRSQDLIRISGAREHNLRGVDLEIPKGKLVCFTGVSGSGKSSMAFDTLYAEGQRRYLESLSSYARQFMGEMPKPDVDQVSGLAPSISIQQKTSGWNPRSTVGTITQVHDYLRVLFARAGDARCPQCRAPITAQTREHMLAAIMALPRGTRILLLAPKVRGQKGEHRDLFADLLRQGFVRARVNGRICELAAAPELDRYRRHDIEVVVDRLVVGPDVRSRLAEALELALGAGDDAAIVAPAEPDAAQPDRRSEAPKPILAGDMLLSSGYACTKCKLSFERPTPQSFSFNSPRGMCPHCDGLGERFDFDPELLIPDPSREFYAPCVAALRTRPGRWRRHIYEGVARHLKVDLDCAWEDLPKRARRALLYGTGDTHISYEWRGRDGVWKHGGTFDGVIEELNAKYRKSSSTMVRRFYEKFMRQTTCTQCGGGRLRPEALAVVLKGRADRDAGQPQELNINELSKLPIRDALSFVDTLELDGVRMHIAREPLKEIRARLGFLVEVGLDYLTLSRAAPTLSGGESQRIRLASQIGCGLMGVLYVLDEPSIGLHPRDNMRLLESLKRLRDMGNTVVVVEHDRDTMEVADQIVDFGPGPGVRGGRVVAQGDLESVAAQSESLTGDYLSGRRAIEIPTTRRPVTRKPLDKPKRTRRRT